MIFIYAFMCNDEMGKVSESQTKSHKLFSCSPNGTFKIDFQFFCHFLNTYLIIVINTIYLYLWCFFLFSLPLSPSALFHLAYFMTAFGLVYCFFHYIFHSLKRSIAQKTPITWTLLGNPIFYRSIKPIPILKKWIKTRNKFCR